MFNPKDFVPDSLKIACCLSVYSSCASFRVRIYKPIGILTHVFMSIFFGTRIAMFLNISIFLRIVEIIVMFLVLKLVLDHANTFSQLKMRERFYIEQMKPEKIMADDDV